MGTLYQSTARQLAETLRKALDVAGDGEGLQPSRLSKTKLAKQAGLSRDTLTRLIPEPREEDPDGEALPNCDLSTLCDVAQTLGVSPAFLLMTPDDWNQLAGAITGIADLNANAHVSRQLEELLTKATGLEKVEVGLTTARAMGYKPIPTPDASEMSALALHELQQQIDTKNQIRKRAIRVGTAVALAGAGYPRPARMALNVVAIGAQIGWNSKIIEKGGTQ